MEPRRRLTGKQPAKRAEPTAPLFAAGLPKRKPRANAPPIMPGLLPKMLRNLEERKKHQGLVDWQRHQRLHEQARNMDNELIRLGTMAGGYLPSMRSRLRDTIEGLVEKRNAVVQKIRDSRK